MVIFRQSALLNGPPNRHRQRKISQSFNFCRHYFLSLSLSSRNTHARAPRFCCPDSSRPSPPAKFPCTFAPTPLKSRVRVCQLFGHHILSRKMYADRLEDEGRTSIKDRLTGNVLGDSACRLSVTGKRQREDDKWKHDLYEDEQPQISRKLGGGDLRLKLRRKSSQQDTNTGGARDLREKLSGIILSQDVKKDPQKPKPEPETVKPTRKSVILEATAAEPNKVSDSASRRKTQQKADASVDGFLQSLGLEKYLITFQAEEVDMTALEHMTDDDLKAMGIPMGPRKKILLALKSGG